MNWFAGRWRSLRCAMAGLALALRTQPNLRLIALATVAVTALGFFLRWPAWKWTGVLISVGVVWTAELANTALEMLANRITSEQDIEIGRAKDVAAGAVLAAVLMAAVIGLIVLVSE